MTTKANVPCVVLVSGGLDSAVTLACAIRDGFHPHCLTFSYGQRHSIEIESAKRVCSHFDVGTHNVMNIDISSFGGSSLTTDSEIPKSAPVGSPGSIPTTYVPARNMVFLSLATSWAEALGARRIYIGVSSVDYSGYPDCRPEFIKSFEGTANLGTKVADGGPEFEVSTPLIDLTKGKTIELGLKLGVDFSHTWSCYDPDSKGNPCGLCDSCRLRKKGFDEAGSLDPLTNGSKEC